MGSFANAVVWRLHAHRDFVTERSECEHCHHVLGATDLVPIFSWLWLRGRCRYCHTKLSVQHFLVELLSGLLFAASYLWWPVALLTGVQWLSFGFWLIFVVGIVMLFLYDLHWQLLPDKIVFTLIWLAVAYTLICQVWLGKEGIAAIADAGGGIAVFSGFFGFLYLVSKGRWLGLGDVKLGVFMGIVLGSQLSLIALLGSYYIAALIIVPLMVAGKVHRRSKVAFGPFLLMSFVLSFFFGQHIVHFVTTRL